MLANTICCFVAFFHLKVKALKRLTKLIALLSQTEMLSRTNSPLPILAHNDAILTRIKVPRFLTKPGND